MSLEDSTVNQWMAIPGNSLHTDVAFAVICSEMHPERSTAHFVRRGCLFYNPITFAQASSLLKTTYLSFKYFLLPYIAAK